MKRFIFLLTTIFICTIARADNVNINWIVGDNTYATTQCEMGNDLILPTIPTKIGYTFRGWRIAKYIPIEYLESTGTQYIDTGYISNSNTKVSIDIQSSATVLSPKCLFGARNADKNGNYISDNRYEFIIWYAATIQNNATYNIRYDYSGSGSPSVVPADSAYSDIVYSGAVVNITKHQEKNYINNILQQESNLIANFSCDHNAFLFACNQGGNTIYPSVLRIYSCKIYDNDVLVRDFFPVIDDDGVPCMYDKVEGKFYYNAGTGQFIAGPIITD